MLPDEATDPSHALQVADERLYAQKYSRRGESERTMAALLEALSIREPELEAQRADVGALAVDVGTMLGLRRDELEELERAAQLHDLGKLAVPDEILHKPGRSTSASGGSSASTPSSASGSCARRPRSGASRASSARATRTGTEAAIPTGSRARRFPSPRGSSASAVRTWR